MPPLAEVGKASSSLEWGRPLLRKGDNPTWSSGPTTVPVPGPSVGDRSRFPASLLQRFTREVTVREDMPCARTRVRERQAQTLVRILGPCVTNWRSAVGWGTLPSLTALPIPQRIPTFSVRPRFPPEPRSRSFHDPWIFASPGGTGSALAVDASRVPIEPATLEEAASDSGRMVENKRDRQPFVIGGGDAVDGVETGVSQEAAPVSESGTECSRG